MSSPGSYLGGLSLFNDSPDKAMVAACRAEGKRACLASFSAKPRQPGAGNAAIRLLGRLPDGAGVPELAFMRTRLRDRSALKLIAASIEAAAQSAGMTVDELEDLAVPTGGLGMDGTRWEVFGAGISDANFASRAGG